MHLAVVGRINALGFEERPSLRQDVSNRVVVGKVTAYVEPLVVDHNACSFEACRAEVLDREGPEVLFSLHVLQFSSRAQ